MGVIVARRELLLADTSFISVWHAVTGHPDLLRMWPARVIRRIDSAAISISVVTLAELRAGHLKARWGQRRRSQTERWLQQFPHHSIDRRVADTWAVLKEATRRRGRVCGDNDLWIAATGHACGAPVVTCDRDFDRLRELGVEVVYLPRRRVGVAALR